MKMGSRKLLLTKGAAIIGAALVLGTLALPSKAVVTYDDNVTPDLILGSGNANGSFTVDRAFGVEVGLRGKVRFNASNFPENTYNSNGDGTYSFVSGAPTGGAGWVSATTPRWNFEWSINTDHDNSSGLMLDDLTYELRMDWDPTSGTATELVFDPINDLNPVGDGHWDHSIGTNATGNGAGVEAGDIATYTALLAANNVAQQSWNYEFFNDGPYSSFDPNEPGTYTISLAAFNGVTEIARSTIQIVVGTRLSVETADDWCAGADVGSNVSVDIYLRDADDEVAGGQFLIAYDASKIDLVGVAAGDHPFNSIIFQLSDPLGDTDDSGIDHHFLAVGNPLSSDTTSADTRMATLTFEILAEFCSEEDLVVLEPGSQPLGTYLTDEFGGVIAHSAANLPAQRVDDTPPTITCPDDILVYADAGTCEYQYDLVQTFDVDPPISATQASGVWYTDRYAPQVFESAFFNGDYRLQHGLRSAGTMANRPGSFSSSFYNYQGRKFDVLVQAGESVSVEMYADSTWPAGVRAGMWATASDGNLTFPIIEFVVDALNSPGDGATNFTGFRWWQSGIGWTSAIAMSPDDAWHDLEIQLTGSDINFFIDSVMIASTDNLGAVQFINVILQGHNEGPAGEYDIYWDNFSAGPIAPTSDDNCGTPIVTYVRSDNASFTFADPFPTGVTTVTWTATDSCGNTAQCVQTVEVLGDNEAVIDLAYDGVLDNPVTHCIEFTFTGTSPTQVVTQEVLFDEDDGANLNAKASGVSVPVPCGDYDCVTIRDPLHSLATSVDLTDSGTQYTASALGADAMVGGNFNGDSYIDILDFGIFVGQFGTDPGPVGGDTDCSTAAPHADITGDGDVGSGDFGFITINFLEASDTGCTALVWNGKSRNPAFSVDNNGGPVTRISVAELQRRGLGNLVKADLNNDQWLDQRDVAAFLQGARP